MSVNSPIVIPNLLDSTRGTNTSLLREKCDAAKILGSVRCESEFLVVYDGQYISTCLLVF